MRFVGPNFRTALYVKSIDANSRFKGPRMSRVQLNVPSQNCDRSLEWHAELLVTHVDPFWQQNPYSHGNLFAL